MASCSRPRKPDADLVRAALGGAKEPLAELVSRHWQTAVSLAARVLDSRELAADAAQEATVAAMTDLGRLRSPDRFGPWFCGIALNVARRWHRQLRPECLGVPAERPSDLPGPAELAELGEIAARVRGAIAVLPDGQREAVLLFYLQGLSHREVAAELSISIGAVKARLHQARAALAPRLAQIADPPKGKTMTVPEAVTWSDASILEIRRGDGEDTWRRKHIVILAERDGEGRLPIWVGPVEATALALALESVESPRPFTGKLAAGLIDAAGASISEVRITSLIDSVFYAAVVVHGARGPQEVDARPSDALNLALAAGAPIRVDRRLFAVSAPGYAEQLQPYPVATAEVAAEAQQRMADLMREIGHAPGA